MVQYDTSRQDSHSLSRKPKVGDVRTNSLRVRVVAEPEALVQLLDLRVRRNLHGRPLHILLLGSLGLGDDALDLLHGEVHAVLNFNGSLSRLHLFILLLLGRPDNRPVEPAAVDVLTEAPLGLEVAGQLLKHALLVHPQRATVGHRHHLEEDVGGSEVLLREVLVRGGAVAMLCLA